MAKFRNTIGIIAIGTALVGLGAVAARYSREIRAARERIKSLGSQVIQTDCGPIEYARVGEGYPILAVHGTMGGFDQGLLQPGPASGTGFQIIAVSRFGYLRTPMPEDVDFNRQADAYACLLDELGIQQVAITTVSGGANASIRFAARYPGRVSALILISPAAPGKVKISPPPRAIFETLRSDLVWWGITTYIKPLAYRIVGIPGEFVFTPELKAEINKALVTTLPLSERIDGSIYDNFGIDAEFYEEISENSPYPLSKIETPVLVINALDDPYAKPENVRGLAEMLPNARLFLVPDGGHVILGHTQEIQAEITKFLVDHVTLSNVTN
jgi:pimeloyl-ACP methyl ester carboxylesterase